MPTILVGRKDPATRYEPVDPINSYSNVSSAAYMDYLTQLHAKWSDCPPVDLQFSSLSYSLSLPLHSAAETDNFFVKGIRKVNFLSSTKLLKKNFQVFSDLTGAIKSGSLTLILAPPGHSKTSVLKCFAGQYHGKPGLSGSLRFNGLGIAELEARGIPLNRLVSYVGQNDLHFPSLTVRETVQFAAESANADPILLGDGDAELSRLESRRAAMIEELLGLSECSQTRIGSALLRGISGGQKRRVTLAELLVTNARVFALDQPTDGLDSAVALKIFQSIRAISRITGQSFIVALQQPAPELYELFDDVMLLRHGRMIFHGPRTEIKSFFTSSLGVNIPPEAEEPSFVVQYLTNPIQIINLWLGMELENNNNDSNAMNNNYINNNNNNNDTNKNNNNINHKTPAIMEVESFDEKSDSSEDQNNLPGSINNPVLLSSPQNQSAIDRGFSILARSPTRRQSVLANFANSGYSGPSIDTSSMLNCYHASDYYQFAQDRYEKSVSESQSRNYFNTANWSNFTRQQFLRPFPRSFLDQFCNEFIRQRSIVLRNRSILISRIVQATVIAFIYGTLYFRLSLDNFQSKMGLLMYCSMSGLFFSLADLPQSAEARIVMVKQLDAGIGRSLPYNLASVVWSLPRIFFETIVFGSVLYWVPNFVPLVANYFYYLAILILTSLAVSQFFKNISFMVDSADVARQLDFPFIVLMVIFGGFLIIADQIPRGWMFLYWLNPVSWSVRALSQNEFLDNSYYYFDSASGGPIHHGEKFLSAFGISLDKSYLWIGPIYLFGFWIISLAAAVVTLNKVRGSGPIGTKRLSMEEEEEAEESPNSNTKSLNNKSTASDSSTPVIGPAKFKTRKNSLMLLDFSSPLKSQFASSPLKSLPFNPLTISWNDLFYSVPIVNQAEPRVLLKDQYGFAKPGTLTALMGESGAGKSTLMDILAGRKTVGKIDGEIRINGIKKSPAELKHLIAYVEQENLHMGLTTVREAFEFSAKLRLPKSVSEHDRISWVNEVIELLGLGELENRLVGDSGNPGISEGQLKLLTIGVELVGNAGIICLDEPTTNLDFSAAKVVMNAIQRIAATGRTVICTIHQPAAELFFKFDRLLLLRSGGEIVYFDELGVLGKKSVDYFSRVFPPPDNKIPAGQNPSNWILEKVGMQRAEDGNRGNSRNPSADDYCARWRSSTNHRLAQTELTQLNNSKNYNQANSELFNQFHSQEGVSKSTRFLTLIRRQFVLHSRNTAMNFTRCLLCLVLSLLFGFIWYRIDNSTFAGLISQINVIFLGLSFPSGIGASAAFPTFVRQRAVFYRENTVGMYGKLMYSLSLTIAEMPYILLAQIIFHVPFYFLVGFRSEAGPFFIFFVASYLMSLCYSSLSQFWLAAFASPIAAIVTNSFFMSTFFMFGGIFIHPASIPVFWKWYYWLNPIPKALIACVLPQFQCSTDYPCWIIDVPGEGLKNSYDYVSTIFDYSIDNLYLLIIYLVLTFLATRMASLYLSWKVSHLKR